MATRADVAHESFLLRLPQHREHAVRLLETLERVVGHLKNDYAQICNGCDKDCDHCRDKYPVLFPVDFKEDIAGVLLLGILDGLLAAVGTSLLMTLRDLSEHKVSVLGRLGQGHDFVSITTHPEAKPISGLLIMRPETPLFFANADRIVAIIQQRMESEETGSVKTLILSLEESPDLDGSSIEAMAELARFTSHRGIALLLARLHDPVIAVLTRAEIRGLPASTLTNWSVDDAVSKALGEKVSR